MYQKIKKLADDAIALQNKDAMEAALRAIAGLCVPMDADAFEAAELAQHQAAKGYATTSMTEQEQPARNAENERLNAMLDAASPVTLKDGKGGKVKAQLVKLAPGKAKKK